MIVGDRDPGKRRQNEAIPENQVSLGGGGIIDQHE